MKFFFKYHLIPIILGVTLALFIFVFFENVFSSSKKKADIKNIVGVKESFKGNWETISANDSLELELVGSLREKNGITLLASSELTNPSEYIPFNYLPDSLGIRVNSFGHAQHQCYAIYCELLALKQYLNKAKICIILSPGWFETEGTNIEAFLEFVRPNFLTRIISDSSISRDEKNQIGKYLNDNLSLIENPDSKINYFVNTFRFKNIPFLNDILYNKYKDFKKVNYILRKNIQIQKLNNKIDWDRQFKILQNQFVSKIKTNNSYILDSYYSTYIKNQDGSINYGEFSKINYGNNQEFEDLKLLVKLLKENGAEPTFIVQNLNPYHYKNLSNFNPLLKSIINLLERNNFPYYNMFTSKKEDYIPGTLLDIMHSGNPSWSKINQFLVNTYYDK